MFAIINANHTLGLLAGALSSLFWTIAYALIIRRGFRDRTFGMPLAALAANLCWEVIFLIDTLAIGAFDARLAMIVPWTVLDGALVVQAFRFGKEDFNSPLIRRWFTVALPCMIGFAGLLLYSFVHEFHDAIGWYVAFGQNLMMSILFVAMLLRRDDLRGQSLAIAISKFLGSLFAFVLALFWSPPSLHEHWSALLPNSYTPIAPLLVTLYGGIFVFDLLYIGLVAHKSRAPLLPLWRL